MKTNSKYIKDLNVKHRNCCKKTKVRKPVWCRNCFWNKTPFAKELKPTIDKWYFKIKMLLHN